MKYESLSDLIYRAKKGELPNSTLNESQIESLVSMIGSRCRSVTKDKLRRRLSVPLSCLKNYGIYGRVIIKDKHADYICGQDWNSEMKTLRECFLD